MKRTLRLNATRGKTDAPPKGELGKARPPSFGAVFALVALGHLVAILLVAWWSVFEPTPKPLKTIEMFNPGDLVKGRPDGSQSPAPAPAPEPQPQLEMRQEAPPQQEAPPPEPAPAPVPPPAPAPTADFFQKPKPPPPRPSAQPRPAPPVPRKPSVDLTEVTRSAAAKTVAKTKPSHARADGVAEGSGLQAGDVQARLGRSLENAGVASGVVIGPSGAPGGVGGEFADYYTLIRDQMYEAWDQPIGLADKKLQTQIQIFIEKDGTIRNASLKRSSGNPAHDASALEAARRVGRIRRPRPEGMDGSVTVNFKIE